MIGNCAAAQPRAQPMFLFDRKENEMFKRIAVFMFGPTTTFVKGKDQ